MTGPAVGYRKTSKSPIPIMNLKFFAEKLVFSWFLTFSKKFAPLWNFQSLSISLNAVYPNESDHSELIWMNPVSPINSNFQSEWTWLIRSILNFNPNETCPSEWIWSIRINPIYPNESELSVRMNLVNPINSNFQSESIRSIRINPNDSEKFVFEWFDGNFGLFLIKSDWPDSFGLQIRLILNGFQIDSDWRLTSD